MKKKYKSRVSSCKNIRSSNKVALSSRNTQLNKTNLKNAGLIANRFLELKQSIQNDKINSKYLIRMVKKEIIKKFNIKIEYLECRNLDDLRTGLYNKPFKLFVSYYLNNIRLIDNF